MIGGDESELLFKAQREGIKVCFNPRAIVYHFIPRERLRFSYFITKSFWEGRTQTRRRKAGYHLRQYLLAISERSVLRTFKMEGYRGALQYLVSCILFVPYLMGVFYEGVVGPTDYKKYKV